MAGLIEIFVLDDKKLSSHMYQISQHINTTNRKLHSYNQMSRKIVNLGVKKVDKNDNLFPKVMNIQNYLLMRIIYTSKKYVSNGEGNLLTRKLHASSINYYYYLLSLSVRVIYNTW